MAQATTRQTIREWITGILQGKAAPAEKLAQIEERQKAVAAELSKRQASDPTFLLEQEGSDLAAARAQVLPELKAAVIADYERRLREWDAGEEQHRQAVATDLLAMEAKLDKWAAHCATCPRPPAGAPPNYFSGNDHLIYNTRLGVVRTGEGLGLYDSGGTSDAPRLAPKPVSAPQVWGVPAGMQRGK